MVCLGEPTGARAGVAASEKENALLVRGRVTEEGSF
jgi:hypothetical protein